MCNCLKLERDLWWVQHKKLAYTVACRSEGDSGELNNISSGSKLNGKSLFETIRVKISFSEGAV